ncbi:MAG TPA: polysaccharide deacetylase family protein [Candidatus Limnocylindria bacterium]|nr:polysaccharide deacetylase family protein [Candidatus Limnocylindria bacterium]
MRKGFAAALAAALLFAPPAAPADSAVVGVPRSEAVTCTDQIGPSIAPPPASSLVTGSPGYRAQFYGQSGYPTLCPGSISTATIAFHNSGSLGWYRSTAPAYLGTWGPEPGQDRASILGGNGEAGSPATGWPSFNRVAVQPADYVGPGQVAWFRFTIKAPTTPGVYKLALRPLIEGKQWLDDYGVFWFVTVKQDDATVPELPKAVDRSYLPTLVNGVRQIRVSSLMYHYVDWLPENPDRFRVDLTVSPTDFEEHLKYLKANGYSTVTTHDIWWTLQTGAGLPRNPVNITFDDGTVGQYAHAFKLLAKYGMKGTFYVTLNLVGKPGYVTLAMVKEMAAAGMDVQSHAMDHVAMTVADRTYQACTSRRILSEWTGTDVRHFAYPGGSYDVATFDALARCGYLSAYNSGGGSLQSADRMLLLSRMRVRGQQGLPALITALAF